MVQVKAWHPLGAKPLPEAMMTQILPIIPHHKDAMEESKDFLYISNFENNTQ